LASEKVDMMLFALINEGKRTTPATKDGSTEVSIVDVPRSHCRIQYGGIVARLEQRVSADF
jgi:hypothetical protein